MAKDNPGDTFRWTREALNRAHSLIEGITLGTEDLIAATDLEFRFTYFNEAYRREFKKLWAVDVEVGTSMLEAMAPWPDQQQRAIELWSRAMAGQSFRVESEFGPSAEERYVYDLRFNPLYDEEGRIVGAAHIFRDITDRVRIQEALRENEARLREADQRKDEYLAMLGHELRNPLAAIKNAAELIKIISNSDPRLERAAGVLERQTGHMAGLIDGLLEVSRIARGKIALERRVCDLRELCHQVVEDRQECVTRSGLSLILSTPDHPVWVLVDPVRLLQILDNLLSNSVKFTPERGQITVTLEQQADWSSLCVRDSGIGIAHSKLETIFEPFYQESQDMARGSGGLGLGLAVARGLVELHDGTIEAHSDGPGHGTAVLVHLPVVAPPEQIDSPPARPAQPRRTILLVEDNIDAAQMLRDLLQLQGHSVHLATTAGEALNILDSTPSIDLVLCDIGLPDMSGYDLAAAVRIERELRDLPIVALTGYGQPEDRRRAEKAGFDAHLVKPIDAEALVAALSLLDQSF